MEHGVHTILFQTLFTFANAVHLVLFTKFSRFAPSPKIEVELRYKQRIPLLSILCIHPITSNTTQYVVYVIHSDTHQITIPVAMVCCVLHMNSQTLWYNLNTLLTQATPSTDRRNIHRSMPSVQGKRKHTFFDSELANYSVHNQQHSTFVNLPSDKFLQISYKLRRILFVSSIYVKHFVPVGKFKLLLWNPQKIQRFKLLGK